jgi:hypothetical protein
MSSLINSKTRLTGQLNNPVLALEEILVFNGNMFTFGEVDITLGVGGVIHLGVTTGSVPIISFKRSFITTSEKVLVETFKDCDFTGGTVIPIYPLNGNNVKTPQVQIFRDPTVNDIGTKGLPNSIARGEQDKPNDKSVANVFFDEIIATDQPDKKLIVRITNQGVAGVIDYRFKVGESDEIEFQS